MSYDVSLEIDTGGTEPLLIAHWSPTYNLGPMFNAAIPGGIRGLCGAAHWVAFLAEQALKAFDRRADELRNLEPSDGWGSYDDARAWLVALRETCRAHPKATVTVQ